jgi:hypothetical protein
LAAQRAMMKAEIPAAPVISSPRFSLHARMKTHRLVRRTKVKNSPGPAAPGCSRKKSAKQNATAGRAIAVRLTTGESRPRRRAASAAPRNSAQNPRHTTIAVPVLPGT